MEPVLDTALFRAWLAEAATVMDREADRLTELDSPIGDADHGANMQRGFGAASVAMREQSPDTPGAVMLLVGRQLISKVGGASGPLYGTALRRAGTALGTEAEVTAEQLGESLVAALDGVRQLGGASAGDKTMVDAMVPAAEAYRAALDDGGGALRAIHAAARAAEEGAVATIPMLARKGRASYLGERSIGHQDPGATSLALLLGALETAVERAVGGESGEPSAGDSAAEGGAER